MQAPTYIDALVLDIAGRQHDVVHRRQLEGAGIGHGSIALRVERGFLVRIFPSVYAVRPAPGPLDADAIAMAGVLAGGPGAALSHESAAVRLGIWNRPTGDDVHILTSRRRPPRHPRVTFHTTSRCSGVSVLDVGGLPTTGHVDTIVRLGTCLTPAQIAHVLHECAFLGRLELERIEHRLAVCGRLRGAANVRRAIRMHRAGSAGTRSRTEDRYLQVIRAAGVPMPLVNMAGATGVRGLEADFVWPAWRLVVEVDGGGHARPSAQVVDAERDELLRAAGWNVVRVPARLVWNSPRRVVERTLRTSRWS